MRSKTLFLLVIVLVGLAVAVTVIVHKRGREHSEISLGQPLFKDLDVNKIALISIHGPGEKVVELKKGEKYWEVVQRYGYPAEFSKITSLVRKISELKVGNSFKATPDVSSRLRLVSPSESNSDSEEQGILISLRDANGKELAGIIIGKRHGEGGEPKGMGGQYIRLSGGDTVYLVDKSFGFIEKDPKGWLDKGLIKVQPEEIKKIYAINGNGRVVYSFERQEKGKELLATGPLKAKKLDKSALRRIERGISFLNLLDVADPKIEPTALGVQKSRYVVYELFNGIRYKIFPGKSKHNGEDEYHVKISVGYNRPPASSKAPTGKDKQGKQKQDKEPESGEIKLKARQLDQRLSPWVFVVSRWNAQAFITDPQRLIEKKSEKHSGTTSSGGNKKKGR